MEIANFKGKDEAKKIIEPLLISTERDGIEGLLKYLDDSGFYIAPASTKYHGASLGALATHSINVYNAAYELANAWLGQEWLKDNMDSLIIVTLLHDLGKAGQFGKPLYIDNMLKSGRSEAQPYKINDELMTLPHEIVSVIVASNYIRLTEDEQRAIAWHNGLYGAFKYDIAGKETPLYMILHFSDMWASRVMEK